MAIKSRKRNKKCVSCAANFSPKLDACPKCGYKALPTPNFVGIRKPLAGGGKLKLNK
jgi:ribosomal protein L40E